MLFHPVSAASRSVVFSSCPQARGPCWSSFIASQPVSDLPEMQGNCSASSSSTLPMIVSLTGRPLSLEAVHLLGVGLHSLHAAGRKQTLPDHVFPCDLPNPQRISLVNKVSYIYHILISCCCYF